MHVVPNTLLKSLLDYFAHSEQFIFFDTARPNEDNVFSYLFTEPATRIQCGVNDDADSFLTTLQHWLDRGYYLAGWFSYEFGSLLDRNIEGLICRPQKTGVVADFGVFKEPFRFNHLNGEHDFPVDFPDSTKLPEYAVENLALNIKEREYLDAIRNILAYIRAGDTYQVNYTLKLLFRLSGSVESFYRNLRRNQSVPYGAYIRWGEQRILSFSPELFFRKNRQTLTVRPMKGTLRRGLDIGEDCLARTFLRQDDKNRSENVMIVDLLRNDLGRVLYESGGGEVRVASLFDVEPYESLLQMTSTIQGRSERTDFAGISLFTLFRALFPCGSVTGAPKIRTMQIIAEQEKECRGVYTGAIGFLSPEGSAVFNVPIRTIVLEGDAGEMGIGSGITHDSDPHDEWQECLLKGRFLTSPVADFQLIETLLWRKDSGYWLLEDHLQRLRQSAEYFYYACDTESLRRHLAAYSYNWPEESRRVRLLLAKDGEVTISSQNCPLPVMLCLPLQPEPLTAHAPSVGFSPERTHSRDVWNRHKTTNRPLYDREYARAKDQGLFDLLFCNEKEEVTEGCISSLVIWVGGGYFTPPLDSGILAGILRKNLLQSYAPVLREKILTVEDVRRAEAIFLCNSVRGVIRVRLLE
jgi:para-aminobenzoate synthetase / 4-amino-4-deoxychorismate lyase